MFCRWFTFWSKFCYCFGKIIYFNFSYSITCYYVALLYSLILKTVLLKYIWLNTSFGFNLNFDKIHALFGVNLFFLRLILAKIYLLLATIGQQWRATRPTSSLIILLPPTSLNLHWFSNMNAQWKHSKLKLHRYKCLNTNNNLYIYLLYYCSVS